MPKSNPASRPPDRPVGSPPAPSVNMRRRRVFTSALDLARESTVSSLVAATGRIFQEMYPGDRVECLQVIEDRPGRLRRYSLGPGREPEISEIGMERMGVVAEVLATGRAVRLKDNSQSGAYVTPDPKTAFASSLVVPLLSAGRVVGALDIESLIPGRFRESDELLATTLGLQFLAGLLHFEERSRRERALLRTISALSAMVEGKDDYTEGHCQRIAEMATALGRHMPGNQEIRLEDMTYAGLLHDIGKVVVPDAILLKPGPLTEAETAVMRTHTSVGRRLLTGIEGLERVALVVEQHHERHDGTGYPKGLAGEDILTEARIISVVDAYDAMTSSRPYRRALSVATARDAIAQGAGRQFHPEVVEIFLDIWAPTTGGGASPGILTGGLPPAP